MIGKQLYITASQEVDSNIKPVLNSERSAFVKKPAQGTGLWTSTWREERQDSDWVEWCVGNDYGDPYGSNWFLLTPQEGTRLIQIDSLKDFHRLLRDYGYEDARLKEYGFMHRGIDFEKLVLEYEGVYLTEKGNAETHLSYPDDLNAWDCESILWFKWCFTEVQRIETPQPVMSEE
jgi:hypothetical protein